MNTKGTRIKKAKSLFVWIRVLSWMVFLPLPRFSASPVLASPFLPFAVSPALHSPCVLVKRHPPMPRKGGQPQTTEDRFLAEIRLEKDYPLF
jgi:hypothetical protein